MDLVKEKVEKATDRVKETLLGTEEEVGLGSQARADFFKHAVKDGETGEYYMTEKEFVDAVAPEGEDYVRNSLPPLPFLSLPFPRSSAHSARNNPNSLGAMAPFARRQVNMGDVR